MQKNKKLTGTARYASINALKGYDQSRRDDMESVAYVIAYLLRGNLPWQGILCKTKEEKYSKILYRKQNISPEQLFNGFPNELVTYINYCRNLGYDEEPDYDYLTNLFKDIIINQLNEEIDYKYDWLKNDVDLNKNIKENYITEDGLIDNENDLNNLSMINNLSNSFTISRANSNSFFRDSGQNETNKDTNHYDEIADDIEITKKEKRGENDDDIINKGTKRKNGVCCSIF